jgi:prepilin-type N-terminal cleavage/methylation domain-containing protein
VTLRSVLRDRRGLTLPELLVSLTVFSIVMGGAIGFLITQQQAFQKGTDDLAASQNLSFGLTSLAQEIRAAGGNVPAGQPNIVYAGRNSFSFNADLTSNVANDPFAIYIDVDAPAGQVTALRVANQITVPGSSPGRTWPLQNYNAPDGSASSAETVTFWFTADDETSRTDDFRLMHQVNNGNPELIARNILAPADTSSSFFRYTYLRTPAAGRQTLQPVPTSWLPISFADTLGRQDSIRAVRISYRVTNGLAGDLERIQAIDFAVGLPNVGVTRLQQCGDAPVYAGSMTAVWDSALSGVQLAFPSSVDENSGEGDVQRYVVWRRLSGATDWGDPMLSIPTGDSTYTYLDETVTPGNTYEYSSAAQDCTPRLSSRLQSAAVAIP